MEETEKAGPTASAQPAKVKLKSSKPSPKKLVVRNLTSRPATRNKANPYFTRSEEAAKRGLPAPIPDKIPTRKKFSFGNFSDLMAGKNSGVVTGGDGEGQGSPKNGGEARDTVSDPSPADDTTCELMPDVVPQTVTEGAVDVVDPPTSPEKMVMVEMVRPADLMGSKTACQVPDGSSMEAGVRVVPKSVVSDSFFESQQVVPPFPEMGSSSLTVGTSPNLIAEMNIKSTVAAPLLTDSLVNKGGGGNKVDNFAGGGRSE